MPHQSGAVKWEITHFEPGRSVQCLALYIKQVAMWLHVYGFIIAVGWLFFFIYLVSNQRKVKFLHSIKIKREAVAPVVVIIPVRNEEEHLEMALRSICNQDYQNYRILLINDRSTDGTQAIMEQVSHQFTHVEIMTITDLPCGWLGKSHALYRGYQHTKEEWLLFTDADVLFKPDTLAKAMQYALYERLDHLTIIPDVQSRSLFLNSLLAIFVLLLEGKHRPWALKNERSTAYLGIGAFNLVSRHAYERVGTHQAFPLRPDDDLYLGKRIKESGGRQDALYGQGQIGLEWYTSVKEFTNGLMKNSFTAFHYRFWLMIVGGVVPMFLFFVLPVPVLLIFGNHIDRLFGLLLFLSQFFLFYFQRAHTTRWWYVFMIPVAGAIMMYILFKAGWKALQQGGIYWRQHFYPLSELKKGL